MILSTGKTSDDVGECRTSSPLTLQPTWMSFGSSNSSGVTKAGPHWGEPGIRLSEGARRRKRAPRVTELALARDADRAADVLAAHPPDDHAAAPKCTKQSPSN